MAGFLKPGAKKAPKPRGPKLGGANQMPLPSSKRSPNLGPLATPGGKRGTKMPARKGSNKGGVY